MFGCVLGQLKPSEFYIISSKKSLGLRPRTFSQLKCKLLGLYPIHNALYQYTTINTNTLTSGLRLVFVVDMLGYSMI